MCENDISYEYDSKQVIRDIKKGNLTVKLRPVLSKNLWAAGEVERAIKHEMEGCNNDPHEYSYGVSCYKSALKMYDAICDEASKAGHTGFSMSITRDIVRRLLDRNPLVPVEDRDEDWVETEIRKNVSESITYRHKYCMHLFKTVSPDGTAEYNDVDRALGRDVGSTCCYHGGIANRMVNEYYPIKFPYMPSTEKYVVETREVLAYEDGGDYDTVTVSRIITPEKDADGNNIVKLVGRSFADDDTSPTGWREIDEIETAKRYELAGELLKKKELK